MRSSLLVLGLTLALGCAGAAEAKTLIYCSEGSPEGFNPQFSTSGTTFDATSRPLYGRLVEFERDTTKIGPGLAESWTVSDDGTVYTFRLRRGVKFHSRAGFTPSRDFNADDVLFSFERAWKSDHPYHKVSGGNYEYFNSMGMARLLKSIVKVDDYTVRFTLTAPEAPFIANLGMDFASILSAEYADKMLVARTPEKVDQEPIGTGPFILVAYRKDSDIRYRANPDYWQGKAKIDDLVFAITPDAAVRYAKLRVGECHVMAVPNPADLDSMRRDPNIRLLSQEGLNIGYWAFNTTKKPFDDKRVRQALSFAVDKKAIVEAVYLGAGTPATNPIPPTIWSYNDALKDYPYDPDRAKKLLAEAGYPNGFETDLWAMPVSRAYNPNARRMAELIQADLAKVGVKANIVQYEWTEYLRRGAAGEHQTMLLGWISDNGDPDNFLHTLLGCDAAKDGTNRARWCFKPFDDLVVAAKRTPDIAKRTELYKQAQIVFKEEAPWFTVAHSVTYQPVRKEVIDYKISPLGLHVFYGVDIQ